MGVARTDNFDGTTHQLSHQWEGNTEVSETIRGAVAEYAGVSFESLPPMDERINTDALDSLFETKSANTATPGCVTFSYYGYTVVVQSTGQIFLRET
ncbi:HalOD1 output domain-containing protein [Haloarcula pellucida]|uniref:Halobacterial output domain-containing protein n=1 Tax=Haloarcula pellucida TaxID=1427151 RepID=A0A830GL41_9EURY|nr:HalOD1 output domain-containing protein [Halomicroarcula pellucida]MBX0349855.1 hypothetical protein [Halomicroarcula pellucida]GGN94679.1 hypothetical protein GCM10009030_21260 [Halomicroarcula pellucida]